MATDADAGADRAADGLETTLPNELFEEQFLIEGALVETLGGGHTESDAFLWFEDTLFAGDLVVVQNHPWVGHGDLEHWIEILEAFEARGPRAIVPGHGPVGGAADLAPLRRYLEGAARRLGRAGRRAGRSARATRTTSRRSRPR